MYLETMERIYREWEEDVLDDKLKGVLPLLPLDGLKARSDAARDEPVIGRRRCPMNADPGAGSCWSSCS